MGPLALNTIATAWANFFAAQVSATATLVGLVVVAISINVSRILSFPSLPGRAAEALLTLLGALVLTGASLVPDQAHWLFGLEVLAVGIVTFLVPVVVQWRSRATGVVSRLQRIARAAIAIAPSALFVLAGIALLAGFHGGLYWLAFGVIVAQVTGVWNAWVLLVEILR